MSFCNYLLLNKGRVLSKQVEGKSLVLEILEEANAVNMSFDGVMEKGNLVSRTHNRLGS